jgi:hypothetical protein
MICSSIFSYINIIFRARVHSKAYKEARISEMELGK